MTLSHIVKRYMHTTSVKNRGAVTQLGWYPRDHMPGNYPKNEEERRAAAIKYGLRPEDYQPYDPDDAINHMGDYPDVGIVTYQQKDPYEAYTDRHFCRNWCEPVPRQFIRYRPDRWTYTGLEEEEFEFTQFVSRVLAVALPFALLYFIANSYSEEMGLIKGWISIKFKVPHMPKQYAYDFYRAFPYEDPIKYPILNYSFEPADKYDPEGDNARAPFNPTQRMQL